jgi:hypothetical protein
MVLFETVVKTNPVGRWYIEITDTEQDVSEICLDLDEYAQKIEVMGAVHGGDIEVTWSAEDNVSPEQINDVRNAMMIYEQKLEAEKNAQDPDREEDGTPKF